MSSEGVANRVAPVSSEEFRRACGRFATGVTIASVLDRQGTPHGLTVSSFTSVSLDPPLVLICLGHAVTIIDAFRAASHFGINVLAEDQRALSERFARKGHDRFDGVSGIAARPACRCCRTSLADHRMRRRTSAFTAGDHDIFVGEMVRIARSKRRRVLWSISMAGTAS